MATEASAPTTNRPLLEWVDEAVALMVAGREAR